MTLARSKHNAQERAIAKALGLSDAQLDALLRIKAGYWPGNAAAVLLRKGLAHEDLGQVGTPDYKRRGLTEAGLALLARAREMGF